MGAVPRLERDDDEPESGVFLRELEARPEFRGAALRSPIALRVRSDAPSEKARWICGLSAIGVFPVAGMLCVLGALGTVAYAIAALTTSVALVFAVRGIRARGRFLHGSFTPGRGKA